MSYLAATASRARTLTPAVFISGRLPHGSATGHGLLTGRNRLAEFYKKLNELNQQDAQAGGTLWLPRPPQLPLAIEESRTMFVLKVCAVVALIARFCFDTCALCRAGTCTKRAT